MVIVRGLVLSGCCLLLLACGFAGMWCHHAETVRTADSEQMVSTVSRSMGVGGSGLAYGAYLAGTLARQNQDYALTARYYEQALAQDPDNQKMKTTVYLLKAVQGQFDEMAPLVSEMVDLRQPELLADYVAAALAIKRGEYAAADDILAEKPAYGLDTVVLPAMRAWAQYGMGKTARAEKTLHVLYEDEKTRPFYWYYTGLMALAQRDTAGADAAFRQMTKKAYPSLTALVFVRDFYRKQGMWTDDFPPRIQFEAVVAEQAAAGDAIRSLKAPETVTPAVGVAMALYDLSAALGPLHIEETGLVLNELALYLMPEATIPKIWGAEVFESMGALRQANRVYDRIAVPSDIILFKKAMNLIQLKDFKAALPIMEQVAARNQENPLVLALLAESYAQTGELTLAAGTYELAIPIMKRLDQVKELGAALFALGVVYDELGEDALAEQRLLAALQVTPDNPMILNYLGYTWLEHGKNESRAFALVKKAHELAPDDPHIMDSLALGYYRQKEYQKALDLAERSTDLIPYSSVANGRLGDIYAALGRYREAIFQYRKALDLKADMTPALRQELTDKVARLKNK